MIKALFIACALAASGGAVYAQAAANPSPSPSGDASTGSSAGSATRGSAPKKTDNVEVKREELGQKLLKRKMELDNDRPNIQPAQAPDRAREKQVTPADTKGQKK